MPSLKETEEGGDNAECDARALPVTMVTWPRGCQLGAIGSCSAVASNEAVAAAERSLAERGPDRSHNIAAAARAIPTELMRQCVIIRAPQQGLTFVAVANTSRLTGAYDMGASDIMVTGPGRLFVESFVLGNEPIPGAR